MRINIFSGGRRIAAIVAVLWASGCIGYAVFAEPYASIYYRVVAVTNPFLASGCTRDDTPEYISKKTPTGDSVSITICFALTDTTDGRRMVPYAVTETGDRVRLADKYSSEVSAFKRGVAERLELSPEAVQRADAARWSSRIEILKNAGLCLVGGLAFWWAMTAAVGWVVRGFLGVPRGKDIREQAKEKAST